MRYRPLTLLLAASLLRVSCSSAPTPSSPSPAATKDTPAVSPAEAAAKLSGFWLVTVQRGGQSLDHSMHIALTAGELVGSITGPDGNSRELSKITLKGDKVSWDVGGERASQRFEGTIKGSSMEGKIKMARGSPRGGGRGRGQGKGGDPSGDGGGDSSASPPGEGQPPSGGGSGGGHGGGGHGGRGGSGRGGSAPEVTWKAFKSVEPPPETTPAPAKPGGSER